MATNPNFQYASLILNADSISDASGRLELTARGDTHISTSASKFNGASLYFDGSGDYIQATGAKLSEFPNGNDLYTFAAWIRPENTGGPDGAIIGFGDFGTSNKVNAFKIDKSGTSITNYWWMNDLTVTISSIIDGNFHHVAATFDGTTRRLFVDGTLVGSDTPGSSHNVTNIGNIRIGSSNSAEYFKGYMDDIIVLKGLALWTGNFTPPSSRFAAYAGQIVGNIDESLAITDWRVTATRCSDGAFAGTATASGTTYSIATYYSDPCNLTIAPKIDYAWSAGKVVALNDYCVPTNPDATQRLFKATDIGSAPHQTHATTEPTWPSSGTVVDNDITWTYVADLVDPVSLGPKIPS
jgi:hypothetical protein